MDFYVNKIQFFNINFPKILSLYNQAKLHISHSQVYLCFVIILNLCTKKQYFAKNSSIQSLS